MSFRKHRPYRRAVRVTPTLQIADEVPAFVPEGARDQLLRIVHAQRARKLRKRGVILERLEDNPATFVWFESGVSFMRRAAERHLRAALLKAARGGALKYTPEGFKIFAEACSETIRQVGMVPELAAPYEVKLMIPGHAPQVLKGFPSDEPFEYTPEGYPLCYVNPCHCGRCPPGSSRD